MAKRATTVEEAFASIEKSIRRGWVQNYFYKDGGACCLTGAINRACFGNANDDAVPYGSKAWQEGVKLYERVVNRIHRVIDDSGIVEFNDNPKTTKKDVITVVKKAAKRDYR